MTLAPRVGTDRGAERVGATRHEGAADGSADGGGLSARALLGVLVAAAVLLPLLSWAVGLYDRATHWGKFVHGVEGLLVALIVGLLLFGWRDHERIDLTDELTALVTMFAGILFGVVWELVEFIRDWSFYSDVQKSNSDTMTDFLWNDVGAVIGAVLAARLYCHLLAGRERHVMGRTAARLFDGPSRVLDQHGVLVTIVVSALAAASVLAVWFASRPLPGFGVS